MCVQALYDEEDGIKSPKSVRSSRALMNLVKESKSKPSIKSDQSDRSHDQGFLSPERSRSSELDRGWFDGNTFTCLATTCRFSSVSLDKFEKHVKREHRVSLEEFKVEQLAWTNKITQMEIDRSVLTFSDLLICYFVFLYFFIRS